MTKKHISADEAIALGLNPFDEIHVPIVIPQRPVALEPREDFGEPPPGFDDDDFERATSMRITSSGGGGDDWQSVFTVGRDGIKGTVGNALLVLQNDSALDRLFQRNIFSNVVEVSRQPPWADEQRVYPRPVNDNDYTRFVNYAERVYQIVFRAGIVGDAIASHAAHSSYDPLHDWLTTLMWDGTPRLTAWLTTYLGAADNEYTRAVARAWCISAVARALKPGCKVDTTMVLEGAQGTGKSTAVRVLVGDRWFLDHLPDLSKPADVAQALAKAWVHELGELATLSRTEVEKIKQFLSQLADAYRPPYGRVTIEQLRRCVFAATTNRDDWARDSTGNRRFLPIRTGVIDTVGLGLVREQLWAEAVHAFRAGEAWHLRDPKVLELAQAEQLDRLEQDAWLGDIERLVIGKSELLVSDLLERLGVETGKRGAREAERVKAVLRTLKWEEHRPRRDGVRQRVWVRPGTVQQDELPGTASGSDDGWPPE